MADESAEEPKRARPVAKPIAKQRDDEDDYDYDDEDDRPRRRRQRDEDDGESDTTGGLIPYKNPKALTAYYVGIFGFFLPLIGGIIAIVLGIQGLKYAKLKPKARGQAHAIIGILGGIFAVCFWLLIGVVVIVNVLNKR
jgi:hypothetical protein